MNNFIYWLISLALLSSSLAAVFQHDIYQRDSLKTRLIKEGRWQEYVALKKRQLHGKFSNFKSTSQNVGDSNDNKYYVNITVGTPQQSFTVVLDTTRGTMIIPDIDCATCLNVRRFDSSKSSTYHKTSHQFTSISDLGIYGEDFVRFGDPGTNQLAIPKATFAQIQESMDSWIADGFMGLGFTAENPDGIDPPIITAIKSGILDNPVVTLFLKRVGSSSTSDKGGIITYGALDTTNCDRNVVYEPLAKPNSFYVSLKKASLGSSQFSGNWVASIDVSTSTLVAPQHIVQAFAKEVNATDESGFGDYNIDCKAKLNLNLTIGTTVFTLTEKEMVFKYEGACVLALNYLDANTWIFGDPWFETFCNVLDYGKKRVGFAKIVNH